MQSDESQLLILYHTDLRGQWPQAAALALAAHLPYVRRLAARSAAAQARASLAGIALALRALAQLLGRAVAVTEIVFAEGQKPRLAEREAASVQLGSGALHALVPAARADFSISHSGPWVGCAAVGHGRIGLDVEMGTEARIADWVVREATLKASGEGLRALGAVRELATSASRLRWREESWHVRRLDVFPGASACVVSSLPVHTVDARAVPLEELFAR
jgi:hypothetical protein